MEGALLLNVVVAQSSAVFKLFAGKNQTLLVRRDTWGRVYLKTGLALQTKFRKSLPQLNLEDERER